MVTYKRHMMQANHPQIVRLPVTSDTTIEAGVLVAVTTGTVATALAASTSIVGISMEKVVNPSGGSKTIDIMVVDEYTVLQIPIIGTAGIAATDLYVERFDLHATNGKQVNTDDTTGGMCIPVSLELPRLPDYAEFVIDKTNLWNS